jgi:hypothetical protein
MDTARVQRGRVAAYHRHREPDDPELIAAAQDLNATMLRRHIEKVVESAPALSAEQRNKLAQLLLGGGTA